jgi:hypothetical protein
LIKPTPKIPIILASKDVVEPVSADEKHRETFDLLVAEGTKGSEKGHDGKEDAQLGLMEAERERSAGCQSLFCWTCSQLYLPSHRMVFYSTTFSLEEDEGDDDDDDDDAGDPCS